MSDSKKENKILPIEKTYDLNGLENIVQIMKLFNTTYESHKYYSKKGNIAKAKELFSELKTVLITLHDCSSKAKLGQTLQEVQINSYSALIDIGMNGDTENPLLNSLRSIYNLSTKIDSRCQRLNITTAIDRESKNSELTSFHHGQSRDILFGRQRGTSTQETPQTPLSSIPETSLSSIPEKSETGLKFKPQNNSCLIS